MKPDKQVCNYCGQEIEGKANKKFCSNAHRVAFARENVRVNEAKANKPAQKPQNNPNNVTRTNRGEGVENHGDIQNDANPHKTGYLKVLDDTPGDDFRESLTKTDKTFYDRAMKDFGEPYYNFDGELRKVKECAYCDNSFETRLSLNRYCKYAHYRLALKGAM